jgi:hypothetical protein
MVSKNSAPHSIRFKNDLWERVVAHAQALGTTPNELIVEWAGDALGRYRPEPPKSPPDLELHRRSDEIMVKMAKSEIAAKREPKPEPFKTRLKGEWSPPGGKKR